MYAKERQQSAQYLHIGNNTGRNLSNLINDNETVHIIISGEGEPFNNLQTIFDILRLSEGNRYFQIITNGFWIGQDLVDRLQALNEVAATNGDHYSLRVSIDSYHAARLQHKKYIEFFSAVAKYGAAMPHLSFAVRSLLEEKKFTRDLLSCLLKHIGIIFQIKSSTLLDDEIEFMGSNINVTYKNLVWPKQTRNTIPMEKYIRYLELKYEKPFTFGNMAAQRAKKGLDVTVKYNGDVFFYGIETNSVANISEDTVTTDTLKHYVVSNSFLYNLYTKPFLSILSHLRKEPEINEVLDAINNPYWVIKRLFITHRVQLIEAITCASHL